MFFPIDHISSSMLYTYIKCGQKFLFRYIDLLKFPKPISVHVGISGHGACQKNHSQKTISKSDLTKEELRDTAADLYVKSVHEGVFLTKDERSSKDTLLGKGKDVVVNAVEKYALEVAPEIKPKYTEKFFSFDFGVGLPLLCRSDVVEENFSIRDFKFGRRKNQFWADTQIQATFNVMLIQAVNKLDFFPQFVYHNIITNKEIVHEPLKTKRGKKDFQILFRYIEQFLSDLEKGSFKPALYGTYPCTPGYCEYWNICPYVK